MKRIFCLVPLLRGMVHDKILSYWHFFTIYGIPQSFGCAFGLYDYKTGSAASCSDAYSVILTMIYNSPLAIVNLREQIMHMHNNTTGMHPSIGL